MTNTWVDSTWLRAAQGPRMRVEHNGSEVFSIEFTRIGTRATRRWRLVDTTNGRRPIGTYWDLEMIGRVLRRWGATDADVDSAAGCSQATIYKNSVTGATWVDTM